MGEVRVEKTVIENVVVGGDMIIGVVQADLMVPGMFGPPARCKPIHDFVYIRTSKGWDFQGIKKKDSIPRPGDAKSIAAARAAVPVVTSVVGAMISPTKPEMENNVSEAFRSVSAACGQMGEVRVEKLVIGDLTAGDDLIVGVVQADLMVPGMFGPPARCKVTNDFVYIRTSKGWDFQGVKKANSVSRPSTASPPKEDSLNATNSATTDTSITSWFPGQWIATFSFRGASWEQEMSLTKLVIGEPAGTWAIEKSGCDGDLVTVRMEGNSFLLAATIRNGVGKCMPALIRLTPGSDKSFKADVMTEAGEKVLEGVYQLKH
jgi:hypothetical protein